MEKVGGCGRLACAFCGPFVLFVLVILSGSAVSQTSPADATVSEPHLEGLKESIVQREQELNSVKNRIDNQLYQLYQDKALQAQDRDEFDRRRLALIEEKKQLNKEWAEFNRKKSQLKLVQQTAQQKRKQLAVSEGQADTIKKQESLASNESQAAIQSQTTPTSDALQIAAKKNQKRHDIMATPPKSSQKSPEYLPKPASLPQLGSSVADTSSFDEAALAGKVASFGEAYASDGSALPTAQEAAEMAVDYVAQSGVSYGEQLAESWFDQFGKAQIDLRLDDEFKVSFHEFDYFMPYYNSETGTAFMQLGFHNWTGRDILNLGLGYRYFNRGVVLGTNVFVDSDLSLGYQRGSLGFEVMTSYLKGYSNAYIPLQRWQDAGSNLEARAASGVDVGLEVQVGWIPGLSLSAEYFKWFGDHVDMGGDFQQDMSLESFEELAENPEGLTVAVEYRPIPLLGFTVERTVDSEQNRNTTLGLDLTVAFDMALSKQLKFHEPGTFGSVESMRESFVERESNIILSYSEQGGNTETSGLAVVLEESYQVTETKSLSITAKVEHSSSIASIEWDGRGEAFLDNPDSLTPTFTAWYWDADPANSASNVYPLTLTVTDAFGRQETVDTEVVVLEDPQLTPTVVITDSNQTPLTSLTLIHGEKIPPQLNCVVESHRQTPGGRSGRSGGQHSYIWEGDTSLLSASNIPDPQVRTDASINDYELKVTVNLQDGQTGSSSPLPVTVLPTTGYPLNAGLDETRDYLAGSIFLRTPTGVDGGTITYKSDDEKVAIANDDGSVNIVGVGSANITITEEAFGNIESESDSYLLTINPAPSGLVWKDPKRQIDDQNVVTKKPSDAPFLIAAKTDLTGSDGNINYRIDGDANVATIANDGTVTLGGTTGAVHVFATQEASDNYLETEIVYDLEVGLLDPNLVWKSDSIQASKKVTEQFDEDGFTFNLPAESDSPATIKYESSTSHVSVDSSGLVTYIKAGTTSKITASVAAAGDYKSASTHYDLQLNLGEGQPPKLLTDVSNIYMGQKIPLDFESEPGTHVEIVSPNTNKVRKASDGKWELRDYGSATVQGVRKGGNYVEKSVDVPLSLKQPYVRMVEKDGSDYDFYVNQQFMKRGKGDGSGDNDFENDEYYYIELKGFGKGSVVVVSDTYEMSNNDDLQTTTFKCETIDYLYFTVQDRHNETCYTSARNMDGNLGGKVSRVSIELPSFVVR